MTAKDTTVTATGPARSLHRDGGDPDDKQSTFGNRFATHSKVAVASIICASLVINLTGVLPALKKPALVYNDPIHTYDAFPKMFRTPNGTLLLFFHRANTHASDRAVTTLMTSNDSGSTWQLYSGPSNYCQVSDPSGCVFSDPVFSTSVQGGGVTENGTIVVFIETSSFSGGGGQQLYFSRSTDNGNTWSAPSVLSSTNPRQTYKVGFGQLVNVPSSSGSTACPSGCIAEPVSIGGLNHEWLVFSYDDGLTWTNAVSIPNMATEEVALAWIGGDQLIGFDRGCASGTIGGTCPLMFAYTANMGAKWTVTDTNLTYSPYPKAGFSIRAWEQDAPTLIQSSMLGGLWTLMFSERQTVYIPPCCSSGAVSWNVLRAINFEPSTVIASPGAWGPQGQNIFPGSSRTNIPNQAIVSGGAGSAFGYPWPVEISSGEFLTVFYDEYNVSRFPTFLFIERYKPH